MTKSVHPTLQWLLGPRETQTGRDVSSLLLRLGFGLSMALNHGWGTWQGLQAGGGADFPDPLGLGGTASMALMAFAELLCALAVAAGLLTRLAVLPPLFGLGVAFFVFHVSDPFHEKELALLYLLAFAAVLALGAGRFSLDRLLAGRILGSADGRARRLGTAALALALFSPTAGSAAPGEPTSSPVTPSADSAAAAASLLRRALSVMGEPKAVERFGPFEVRSVGTLDKGAEGQGFSPHAPSPGPYEEIFVVDPATDRIAWEYREERYDGTSEAFREAYLGPDERLIVVHDPPLAIPARSRRFAEERLRLTRRIPHLALAELLERSPRLRLESVAGSPPRVLGSLADGTLLEAEIDAEQGVLERLTYVAHLSGKGDTEVTWWFDDYRPVAGLGLYPFRYGSTVGTLPYTDMTVQSVEPGGLERLTAPTEYRQIPEQQLDEAERGDPPPLELQEVDPGVYRVPEVRSGFAPLVVAFEDSLAVVDAPASFPILGKIPAEETDPAPHFSWHSERLVEAIHQAFPQRPLRYLILTHGHEDHVGGVRAFVAAGATVLAAPAVRPVVERLVASPAAQVGDRLAGMEGATLRFEAVEGPRTLGDGPRRIELLPLGDNPHAQGMLAVHLPAHQALFVSDLITPEPLAVYPRPAHAALDRFLARWIAESGLELVRVLAMHGAPYATPEHLAQARGSS